MLRVVLCELGCARDGGVCDSSVNDRSDGDYVVDGTSTADVGGGICVFLLRGISHP